MNIGLLASIRVSLRSSCGLILCFIGVSRALLLNSYSEIKFLSLVFICLIALDCISIGAYAIFVVLASGCIRFGCQFLTFFAGTCSTF